MFTVPLNFYLYPIIPQPLAPAPACCRPARSPGLAPGRLCHVQGRLQEPGARGPPGTGASADPRPGGRRSTRWGGFGSAWVSPGAARRRPWVLDAQGKFTRERGWGEQEEGCGFICGAPLRRPSSGQEGGGGERPAPVSSGGVRKPPSTVTEHLIWGNGAGF